MPLPEYYTTAEPEPTSWPETEPTTSLKILPEFEPTNFTLLPESEITNSPLPEIFKPKPEGEPVPEWSQAQIVLGAGWGIHIYAFAVCFLIIAVYGIRPTYLELKNRRRPLTLAFNIMLILFGLTRFICLTGDPYGSSGRFDAVLLDILWSVGEPLLTGAFLLFLSLLQDITKGRLTKAKYMKSHVMIRGIVFNFMLELSTDFCLNYTITGVYLTIACHIYYFFTGLFICVTFSIVGNRIRKDRGIFAPLIRIKLLTAVILSAFLGLLLGVIFIYSACDLALRKDVMVISPWTWWVHQTVMRCIELAMAVMAHVLYSVIKQYKPTVTALAQILPI